MAELVDALASGASGGNPVEVQVLSAAPPDIRRDAGRRPFFVPCEWSWLPLNTFEAIEAGQAPVFQRNAA